MKEEKLDAVDLIIDPIYWPVTRFKLTMVEAFPLELTPPRLIHSQPDEGNIE